MKKLIKTRYKLKEYKYYRVKPRFNIFYWSLGFDPISTLKLYLESQASLFHNKLTIDEIVEKDNRIIFNLGKSSMSFYYEEVN